MASPDHEEEDLARALRPPLLAAGWLDAVVVAAIASILLTMAEVFRHVDWKRTYHTGFEPYDLTVVYGAMAMVAVVRIRRKPKRRWISAVLVVVALASSATIVWLDQTNLVVNYNRWLKRGMPERSF